MTDRETNWETDEERQGIRQGNRREGKRNGGKETNRKTNRETDFIYLFLFCITPDRSAFADKYVIHGCNINGVNNIYILVMASP